MRYFSMFSGIGGFELGIQNAFKAKGQLQGWPTQPSTDTHGKRLSSQPLCIGYSEIDKHAIKTYEEYFTHENYGDATKINARNLPDFDLLVGGFPCQSFSVAGKRKGFDDTRGTLFFDIARILAEKRPGHIVLENVKGLLSHDGGKTFTTILGVLTDLGYNVEWQVLNSKDFRVPQNRERVYIVGHLGDRCGRQIFPITEPNRLYIETRTLEKAVHSGTQTARQYASWNDDYLETKSNPQATRVRGTDGHASTLSAGGGGQGGKTGLYAIRQPLRFLNRNQKNVEGDYAFTVDAGQTSGIRINEATKKGYALAYEGDSVNLTQPNSKTRRGRVGKGVANTLDTGVQQGVVENTRIRRLTPVECERLQGFPDNWTLGSDTQRYKQCGNAVTTNVVEAVISLLKPCLK